MKGMSLPPEHRLLLRGTLYPVVIESTSFRGPATAIKSHHNAGGLPSRMKRALLEPRRRLFKGEVRAIFRELDLPRDSVRRRPVPRYGLGIRILGEGKAQSAATLRAATGSYKDYGLKQVHRAIGKRDRHFLVDTGRLSELAGAADPGAKRKIRGRLVIKGIGHAVKDTDLQPEPRPLLQGTLYPVGVESTSFGGSSTAIKSHQDVGTLPSRMKRARREPRRRLFEDEVRAIFRELDLPRDSVRQHPFPRYGLGVRILGEVKAQVAVTLCAATGSHNDYLQEQVRRAVGERDRPILVGTGRFQEDGAIIEKERLAMPVAGRELAVLFTWRPQADPVAPG